MKDKKGTFKGIIDYGCSKKLNPTLGILIITNLINFYKALQNFLNMHTCMKLV